MKNMLTVLVLLGLFSVVIAACSRDGGTSTSPSSSPVKEAPSGNVVHMNDVQFVQNTITIKKGEQITLIDDGSTLHVIANGTWQSNGLPKYALEPGAPAVQAQFSGKQSHLIGPFLTAGTFHLYCTVHQGMTLTVVVQ